MSKLKKSLTRFNQRIDETISPELSRWQRLRIYIDYRWERLRHGIVLANYFEYEFYGRNQRGRRQFVCKREGRLIYRVCNPEEDRYLTGDKAVFNRRFSRYLNRRWLDTTTCTYEEFCAFLDNMETFFIKPAKSERGIGNAVVKSADITDRAAAFQEYVRLQIVMEELIHQHAELAEFNPTSVNTLRVVTLRDARETVHVMAGVLRMGAPGSVVDNFHNHGIIAVIDVDTGIVSSRGLDFEHNYYVTHPGSNKPIVGFRVPYWDKVVELVKEAALLLPELRYIGWDISVGEQGELYLVEGNSTPDTAGEQAPEQVGKWAQYKPLIEELAKTLNR